MRSDRQRPLEYFGAPRIHQKSLGVLSELRHQLVTLSDAFTDLFQSLWEYLVHPMCTESGESNRCTTDAAMKLNPSAMAMLDVGPNSLMTPVTRPALENLAM
ncbi:MAG: hypothetical protein CM1200mP27_08170 [Chloroflexota bacterium]|nr:MAG: hypothetical protein CM1200mP27_08170 [Chloroflexota bacterium]